MYLSQVLGSECGALNASLYLRFEFVERPFQGCCDGSVAGQGKGQTGTQEPGVAASAEQGCTQAHGCHSIAMGVRCSFDETVETEPPQLIRDGTLANLTLVPAGQSGPAIAQVGVAKFLRLDPEQHQGVP